MKNVFSSLVFCLIFAIAPIVAVAQEEEERVVPSPQYPTISSALSWTGLPVVVRVLPGVYQENLRISRGEFMVYAETPGTVIIVGDPQRGNTINCSSPVPSDLILWGIRIVDTQSPAGFYSRAAVFQEFGGTLLMVDCEVYTNSTGVVVNYNEFTAIVGSRFFGYASSTGLFIGHQSPQATLVIDNSFFGVGTGIDARQTYSPLIRCWEGEEACDSNRYYQVATPFMPPSTP